MLMPDIFRGGGVNRILRDVGGVIADPLEMARDENQIQIAAQLVGDPAPFARSSGGWRCAVHLVELLDRAASTARASSTSSRT